MGVCGGISFRAPAPESDQLSTRLSVTDVAVRLASRPMARSGHREDLESEADHTMSGSGVLGSRLAAQLVGSGNSD